MRNTVDVSGLPEEDRGEEAENAQRADMPGKQIKGA
jgi:hypothetical protein